MSLHCQGYARLPLLNCIILEVSNEVWSLREILGLVCHGRTLFSDSAVLGQRWVWLPVWLCAAVRQPQPGLSVGPSGGRDRPGSGAEHMAGRTPGSCRRPEPAITHTMLRAHVHVRACVCATTTCILYFRENWHFSCFTAEWSMQTMQDEWRNSSSLHVGTIYFMWVMQRQTQAPVSARQGHGQWA